MPMTPATLYTTNKRIVSSHNGYIPVVTCEKLVKAVNSFDVFVENEIQVDNLPVNRFCFTHPNGEVENRFFAFDRELEEIIQVMLDDYTRELQNQHRNAIEQLSESYDAEVNSLMSLTIWDMIKLKFKKLLK